jgi:hypothetical protein
MPTPPKPVSVLRMEGRSHRTKKELEAREKLEKAQLTGQRMREPEDVKKDEVAHATWKRVAKLLAAIGKADALYEQQIARYCRLASEAALSERQMMRLAKMQDELDEARDSGETSGMEYVTSAAKIADLRQSEENMLMRRRKMMFDIERESLMSIAASLRAIPKAPVDEAEDDPMAQMLARRMTRS